MPCKSFGKALLIGVGLALAFQAPVGAQSVGVKKTQETYFLYRLNFGPYSKVDRPLRKLREYTDSKGLEGDLIGIYYDVSMRTAPSMQRADLGIPIGEARALEMLIEARPETLEEDLKEELASDKGALLEGTTYIKVLPGRLVATTRVREEFLKFGLVYLKIRDWCWGNGYFIVGPVMEVYHSPVHRKKVVSASVQIGVERSGVPDRR